MLNFEWHTQFENKRVNIEDCVLNYFKIQNSKFKTKKMAKSKKAKVEDYRSLDNQALNSKIQEEEVRIKKMKFSHAVNPLENPLSIRQLRRTIARLKTEQRKRTSVDSQLS